MRRLFIAALVAGFASLHFLPAGAAVVGISEAAEFICEGTGIVAPPPILSSPQTLLNTATEGPPSGYPKALIPWAIFFVYSSFFVVTAFQYRFLTDHSERTHHLRYSPEWRLIGIFTATLAAMMVMQLGFATYASSAFFRILERHAYVPWLVFALGFLPLPALLIEALCAVRHPGIGATRHYYNNLRLSEGHLADLLRKLERRRERLRTPKFGHAPLRWASGIARLLLVYFLSPLSGIHIRRNTMRFFWSRPFRVAGQFFVDLQIIYLLVLALLALGFAIAGIEPGAGFILGDITINATLLIRMYLGSLLFSALMIVWLSAESDDVDTTGQRRLSWRLLLAIATLLGLVATDIWVATLPVREDIPSLKEAINAGGWEGVSIYLAWANYVVRAYAGGWSPVGLAMAILVMAVHYQMAVGRAWQKMGMNVGQRLPYTFMMKTRHRGLNLLAPIQLALTEAEHLIHHPDTTRPDVVSRMVGRALDSVKRMETWFEDIRLGGSAMNPVHDEDSRRELTPVLPILEEITEKTAAYISLERTNNTRVPVEIEVLKSDKIAPLLLDINRASLVDCVLNLTHNACEAIWSDDTPRDHGHVLVSAFALDDPLYPLAIAIDDDGPGVPLAHRERIFDPLFSHGKERGTGMGLYVVKGLMEAIGGMVSLHEAPMGGARFILFFPIDAVAFAPGPYPWETKK